MSKRVVVIILSLPLIASQIKIETADSLIPLDYNCKDVDLGEEKFLTCACLDGIWAFLVRRPGAGDEWKTIGGTNKCIYVGHWVRHMKLISGSVEESHLMWVDNETVIVVNSGDWQVRSQSRQLCLQGAIQRSYCQYKLNKGAIVGPPVETCDKDATANAVAPVICESFLPTASTMARSPWAHCVLIPDGNRQMRLNRVEREANEAPARNLTAEMDEEYIDPTEREKFRGDPSMMDAIGDAVLRKASEILELEKDSRRKKRSVPTFDPPAFYLLKICARIFRGICTALKPELYDVAIESFMTLQKNVFLLREPYIAYAPYERILRSLERCHNNSEPFKFFQNESVLANDSMMCEKQIPEITTPWIFDLSLEPHEVGYIRQTREIPDYAASDPNVHEPVSEIVWKMFVNTLSFCYPYFKSYYNDHHTFTVTLMPFFTNQIQDIWFPNGTNFTSAANSSGWLNYTTDIKWYGNLFGNLSRLYLDLDHCYSAAKTEAVAYPYFMNRPPRDFTNEWSRRKRSSSSESFIRRPCVTSES